MHVVGDNTNNGTKELVDHSYELVKSGLTKQQKKELEGL
jgi:predicted DNA-binding protein (MmcQ/YjbR family)